MFQLTEQASCLSIVFSPALDLVDNVCFEVRLFLEKHGMERLVFTVILLTREALINAVMHGCSLDSSRTVHYSLSVEPPHLVIGVEDDGAGFDWRGLLCKEPDLSLESGRGIAIMREYSTEMAYNSKGNRLTLRKTIDEA